MVYVNFEDERIISPKTEMLTNLIPEIQAIYGKKPKFLFLDELQLVPNWSKWVRRILDSEDIKLFITGSSSKMGSSELPTELRGRAWEVKVNPLNFSEFLTFKKEKIDFKNITSLKGEEARFRFLFEEYLIYGGLPAVVLTPEGKKQELLQSYFQTVVQKDILERHKIDNDNLLKILLKLLVNSSYITISKLANNLKSIGIGAGKTTIINYISYITSSYFMNELFIFQKAVINQLQYPRKVYFVDTGFMTALSTKFSKNMGRLFENAVFQKINSQNDAIHYYKDRYENEVDFVILEDGKTKALYQVCFDLTDKETQKREVKSLVKIGKTLNCKNLNLITMSFSKEVKIPEEINIVTSSEYFLAK